MTTGIATRGYQPLATGTGGGGGGPVGPSDVAIYFTMRNIETGELDAGLDLSAAGVAKVSADGDNFVNIVGDAPTSVGRGLYYYIVDASELPAGDGSVFLSVVLADYGPVMEQERIGTSVSAAVIAINAATVNALNQITAAISAAIVTIDSNTDSEVAAVAAVADALALAVAAIQERTDNLPSDPAGLTNLATAHGAGSWAGGSGAEVVAAILAYSHDVDATLGGLFVRLEAALAGAASDQKGPRTKFYKRDGTVAYEGDVDPLNGQRGISDISGSEP